MDRFTLTSFERLMVFDRFPGTHFPMRRNPPAVGFDLNDIRPFRAPGAMSAGGPPGSVAAWGLIHGIARG